MSRLEEAREFGRTGKFKEIPAVVAASKTPILQISKTLAGARKTPILQSSKLAAAKDSRDFITISDVGVGRKRKQSEEIFCEKKLEKNTLCHVINPRFPTNAKIRGKMYNISMQRKNNFTSFSQASQDTTFKFFLIADGVDIDGNLEVCVREDRIILSNFFFDVNERDAEIALRMVFLFLTLENPKQTIFETNVFGSADRHCDSTTMKRFFKKIGFFQAVERSTSHFASSYTTELSQFECFCDDT